MSLHVRALASGSSGNAFLVRTSSGAVLLEAGLSARTLERLLRRHGVDPGGLEAIVVTHEHHDHARGAGPLARRFGAPVVCNAPTAAALGQVLAGVDVRNLHDDGITVGDVELWSFAVPHDAAAPVGVLLRHDGRTVGLALDCGHVQPHMAGALREADLLVVEANHDRERLLATAYPWSTKHRIMSALGHLSNFQAAELLHAVASDGKRRHAWLAHLSERANDRPKGVIQFMRNYLNMLGGAPLDLGVALRDRPSVSWSSDLAMRQDFRCFPMTFDAVGPRAPYARPRGEGLDPARPAILIVDDHEDNVELLRLMLAPQGYRINTAHDGVAALEAVRSDPPDLLLLDVMMPGLSGFQVVQHLRSDSTAGYIPVMLITAKQELSDKVRGLEYGADDFLAKPVHSSELIAKVRALLRLKQVQDALVRERNKNELLYQVGQQLAGTLDVDQLIRQTLTLMVGLVGAAYGSVIALIGSAEPGGESWRPKTKGRSIATNSARLCSAAWPAWR